MVNQEAGRLQLVFGEKPSPEHRAQLKANGFRWAPKAGAETAEPAGNPGGREDGVCPSAFWSDSTGITAERREAGGKTEINATLIR